MGNFNYVNYLSNYFLRELKGLPVTDRVRNDNIRWALSCGGDTRLQKEAGRPSFKDEISTSSWSKLCTTHLLVKDHEVDIEKSEHVDDLLRQVNDDHLPNNTLIIFEPVVTHMF